MQVELYDIFNQRLFALNILIFFQGEIASFKL